MEPIIARSLFESISILKRACRVLADKCVKGITAHPERCLEYVEKSISIVTALNPILGYEITSEIAIEAAKSGTAVYHLVLDKGLLEKKQLDEVLCPEKMVTPHHSENAE
jgi:aspartate ammonia-lyase